MIGPLEIAILVAFLLVVFGAKFLPALGRSAGTGVRVGRAKSEQIASVASEKAQERASPSRACSSAPWLAP